MKDVAKFNITSYSLCRFCHLGSIFDERGPSVGVFIYDTFVAHHESSQEHEGVMNEDPYREPSN